MQCPLCGEEMIRGWLICGPPVLWSQRPKKAAAALSLTNGFAAPAEDIRLQPDETGHPVAWRCRSCRKALVDC